MRCSRASNAPPILARRKSIGKGRRCPEVLLRFRLEKLELTRFFAVDWGGEARRSAMKTIIAVALAGLVSLGSAGGSVAQGGGGGGGGGGSASGGGGGGGGGCNGK